MDIREITRSTNYDESVGLVERYRAGQTIRSIAGTMGHDRKTVRKYIVVTLDRG